MKMEDVQPRGFGGFDHLLVKWEAEGLVFFEREQRRLRVLDGVEDSVNVCFERGFHEAARRPRDGFESLHHRVGMEAEVRQERVAAREIFRLRQRTEHGLDEGSLGGESLLEEAETFQLRGKTRRGWIQLGQARPVARSRDDAFDVAARPLGVSLPNVVRAPVLETERRGGSHFDEVEIVLPLPVKRRGGERFGRLVVHGEVAPERDGDAVGLSAVETGLEAFAVSRHGTCFTTQKTAAPRRTSPTVGASWKV